MRGPFSAPMVALSFILLTMAGCLDSGSDDQALASVETDVPPNLDYTPIEPDGELILVQEGFEVPGAEDVMIHLRTVMPEAGGPFPVIVQFTPYTAPGESAPLNNLIEPTVQGTTSLRMDNAYEYEFARRGYAYVRADVRGTGDSTGCLDLRGDMDIADLWHLTEYLGTADWSTGRVGFIGASYPGSEAHMAALANNEHLAAVVPIVASTSFYHYHHNDGVPYMGQHSLGGTNTGYTSEGVTPTVNPDASAMKLAEQAQCPHVKHAIDKGGMDQTGTYDDWWMERNLREGAKNITVPVLMAQGLADWNVKPDHIATWFNDIPTQKTLIAGQWGHAYPRDNADGYGDWWPYVTAFFDTYLKEEETGMFQTDVAWVQDNDQGWHRSSNWPLAPDESEILRLHLKPDGSMGQAPSNETAQATWHACNRDEGTKGVGFGIVQYYTLDPLHCTDDASAVSGLVFESEPVEKDMHLSGVPLVDLTLKSSTDFTHLVVVMDVMQGSRVVQSRENYGYLNPMFRNGLEDPEAVPVGEAYNVQIDLYPQEDVLHDGEHLRITIRSHDDGRTIESFNDGTNTILFGPESDNSLQLPLRPKDLQGVRLG